MSSRPTRIVSRFFTAEILAYSALFFALIAFVAAPHAAAQVEPQKLFAAVVGVEADVPAEARTADSLGTHREGSGVVISDDGLVLTIGYLIMEAGFVDVVKDDGQRVPAQIVAYDHASGFGLVRALEDLGVTPIAFGDSAELSESSPVLVTSRSGAREAIGAQVVSRRVFTGSWEYMLDSAIFTSPPHRGFGGAALFGPDGALLGIGSLFVGDAAGTNRRLPGNMFVPIDLVKPILADLIDQGRRGGPARPWLGVYPQMLGDHVVFGRIAEDSPASLMGLEAGDLVVTANGKGVGDLADFYRAIWGTGDAGVDVPLTILRSGAGLQNYAVPSIDRREWLRLNPSF